MENTIFGLVFMALWLIAVVSAYFYIIKRVLPHFDDLTPHERVELLKTRRQRYIDTFTRNKKRR